MRPSTVLVMGLAALAVVKALPADDTVAQVKIQSIPSKVSNTGAVTIPVSEVIAKSKKVAQTPAEDRFWHSETTTTPAPHHGWGWGGWGWPAPADDHPWAPTPEPYVAPTTTAAPAAYTPAFSGPFAFQLGAYYNPFIPAPVESPPAYPHYPAAPAPRPTQYANYGHSPVIRQPSAYAPAPAPYSPPAAPAPAHSYSASSSYPAPAAAPAHSYSAPSSYSAPAAASYGSSPY